MPYIGKQIGIGNYQVLDALTATTTDTYALTKNSVAVFPQTPANCIVSLNGVIQAPFSSYTISGSNIVFDSALTGSDSIDFITVLGDVLNVGTVSDGTIGLAKLSATGTKDATTFLRGDNTFASAGGDNTPAFSAYLSANYTGLTDNVETLMKFDTEVFDSNSSYDNTSGNYKFTVPSGEAGKYRFETVTTIQGTNSNYTVLLFYKNGAQVTNGESYLYYNPGSSIINVWSNVSQVILDLSVGDYIQIYTKFNTSDSSTWQQNAGSTFSGYKLIGV